MYTHLPVRICVPVPRAQKNIKIISRYVCVYIYMNIVSRCSETNDEIDIFYMDFIG